MTEENAPNLADLARRLGVSRSSVSRFWNGSRLPVIGTRVEIEKHLRWTLGQQAKAEAEGQWCAEFRRRVQHRQTTAAV